MTPNPQPPTPNDSNAGATGTAVDAPRVAGSRYAQTDPNRDDAERYRAIRMQHVWEQGEAADSTEREDYDKWADSLRNAWKTNEWPPQQTMKTHTALPGMIAKHAIVTDVCRTNKTDAGATAEALERLRAEAIATFPFHVGKGVKFHFVLLVEQ